MLVAAVLGPENGEDRELEVVRGAAEESSDTVELPVGETERPVESLLRDRGQAPSVSGGSDGPGGAGSSQRPLSRFGRVPSTRDPPPSPNGVSLRRGWMPAPVAVRAACVSSSP